MRKKNKSLTDFKSKARICCTGVTDEIDSVINRVGSNCGVIAKSTELNVFVLLSSLTVLSDFLKRRNNDLRVWKLGFLLFKVLSLFALVKYNCTQLWLILFDERLFSISGFVVGNSGLDGDLQNSIVDWFTLIDDRWWGFLKKRCNDDDNERYRPCFLRRIVRQCRRLSTFKKMFEWAGVVSVEESTLIDEFDNTDERLDEIFEVCESMPAPDSHELK
jgi:hypothetical protein